MTSVPQTPVLQVDRLCVDLGARGRGVFGGAGVRRVLHEVSCEVARGKTLAVVGESGSGKSTLARAVLGLIPCASGSVRFEGREISSLSGRALRETRARVQIIFQDPYSAMNPRHRVEEIVTEPLIVHRRELSARARREIGAALLERCGMPADSLDRYPHQFSGGQRQRIAIARALTLEPSLIVCDEPTSALDVSVRAQILNLLGELQRERGVAYLFISHDMATVRHVADAVIVMKDGRVVESGGAAEVLDAPRCEYTRTLLDAVPRLDAAARRGARVSSPAR